MNILDLNHVALHVSDVSASIAFYRSLGLKTKPRPDFDFDGAWFALGPVRELHLLEGLDQSVHEDPRGSHFAMEVDLIDPVKAHLEHVGIPILKFNIRPDGAHQIFIEDPDQHVVEFCQQPPSPEPPSS